MTLRPVFRGLVVIATLVTLGWLIKATGIGHAFDTAWIDAEVRGHGLNGELLFVAAGALFTALGLPRQAVCFMGGYAFGFGIGTALSLAASVGGCLGAFLYARLLGRTVVRTRLSDRIRRLDGFLSDNPLSMTLLIRLLPVGSNLLTNLGAGVSNVAAVPFVVGSAIGYIPQTAIFALLGSGIQIDPVFRTLASVVLFVASAAVGAWLYRRFRRGRVLGADVDAALGEADPTSAGARPEDRDGQGVIERADG